MLALAALTCCTDAHSEEEAEVETILAHKYNAVDAVSYTHLTLPTKA